MCNSEPLIRVSILFVHRSSSQSRSMRGMGRDDGARGPVTSGRVAGQIGRPDPGLNHLGAIVGTIPGGTVGSAHEDQVDVWMARQRGRGVSSFQDRCRRREPQKAVFSRHLVEQLGMAEGDQQARTRPKLAVQRAPRDPRDVGRLLAAIEHSDAVTAPRKRLSQINERFFRSAQKRRCAAYNRQKRRNRRPEPLPWRDL